MRQINIKWCVELVQDWFNENPSLSWGEIHESLIEYLDGEPLTKQDWKKIKLALSMQDYY